MEKPDHLNQFERFYEATKTPVFRAVLLARAGDRDAAEGAVAEAYERAFLRWDKLVHHPNPTAWVIRTAINQRISAWRRWRRGPAPLPNASLEPQGLDPALVRLLRNLPEGQRKVLALRILLEFSTEQTAEALGVRQGTVKTQLHRALNSLRLQLQTHEVKEVCQ